MSIAEYIFNAKTAAVFGATLVATAPAAMRALPQTTIVVTVSSVKASGREIKSTATPDGGWLFLNLIVTCRGDPAKSCSSGMRKVRFPGTGEVLKFNAPDSIKKQQNDLLTKVPILDQEQRFTYDLELPIALKGQETISITLPINGKVNAAQDIRIMDEVSPDLLKTKFECRDLKLNTTEVTEISKNSCEEKFGFFERIVLIIPGVR